MKEYTLGFYFSADLKKVLLIKKNKPEWQAGRWNGVGGQVESKKDTKNIGALQNNCMVREFEEETGIFTGLTEWNEFALLRYSEWNVYVYYTIYRRGHAKPESITGEKVFWYDLSKNSKKLLPNLSWLIPMALEIHKQSAAKFKIEFADINYL